MVWFYSIHGIMLKIDFHFSLLIFTHKFTLHVYINRTFSSIKCTAWCYQRGYECGFNSCTFHTDSDHMTIKTDQMERGNIFIVSLKRQWLNHCVQKQPTRLRSVTLIRGLTARKNSQQSQKQWHCSHDSGNKQCQTRLIWASRKSRGVRVHASVCVGIIFCRSIWQWRGCNFDCELYQS